jgi:hypothetical protein
MLSQGKCTLKQYKFLVEEVSGKFSEQNYMGGDTTFHEVTTKFGENYSYHFINDTIFLKDEVVMITSYSKALAFDPQFYGREMALNKFFFTKKASLGILIDQENIVLNDKLKEALLPKAKLFSIINEGQMKFLNDGLLSERETQE